MKKKSINVTISSFPKKVRPAVRLLGEVAEKALQGVGCHVTLFCPIARAYKVNALSQWGVLEARNQRILFKHGWSEFVYNNFIAWYDACHGGKRENFLRAYLEGCIKKVPSKK